MKRLLLILLLVVFISCEEKNDDGIVVPVITKKLLNSISFDNETNIDSMFYENGRLVLKKDYVGAAGFLDYSTFYKRNEAGQLLKFSYVHSTSTDPSFERDYTYYDDGTLKAISRSGYQYTNLVQRFSYKGNQIFIKMNDEQEASVIANLDSKNRIKEVLFKKDNSNEYYRAKEYFYNAAGNAYKIIVKDSQHANTIEYNYEFDNAENPYLSLDTNLPNGLTLNILESLAFHDNYGEPREDHLPFFSKNNVVKSFTTSYSNDYLYTYDEDNYPIGIKYNTYFSKPTLILDYK